MPLILYLSIRKNTYQLLEFPLGLAILLIYLGYPLKTGQVAV